MSSRASPLQGSARGSCCGSLVEMSTETRAIEIVPRSEATTASKIYGNGQTDDLFPHCLKI